MNDPRKLLIKPWQRLEKIYHYPMGSLTRHFIAGHSIVLVLKRSLLTKGTERKIEL